MSAAGEGDPVSLQWNLRVITAQWTVLSDWDIDDLRAPYWRFYWNPAPGARIRHDRRWSEITPDRFYLIPPETSYASTVTRPTVHFYAHFQTSHRWAFAGIQRLTAGESELRVLRKLLGTSDKEPAAWTVIGLLASTLARLPQDGWALPSRADARILKAQKTIDSRLPDSVPVPELAADAGMNIHAFIRLFRQRVGSTPARYGMERRIEIACMLLHHSDRSIEEIAASCGFCDRYHFTRCFAKYRGMAPAAFRRQSKPSAQQVESPDAL